jgi:C-terminal processing protease CtpA/Prc
MSTRGYLISETKVVGAVQYVSADSPAADSAIKRGDLIVAVDGTLLNVDNYYELMGHTTATYSFGDWNGTTVVPNGREVTLTAVQLDQNPVSHSEIIEYQEFKIGYLAYTQFTFGLQDEWFEALNTVFESFISAGVTDVVVDLRYNRGGYGYVAEYIASTLGPKSISENEDIFLEQVWNDAYTQFWKDYDLDGNGEPDGVNSSQLVIRFPGSELNLNLSKIYFLTADLTASASEALMIGLYPYMDVVQVGGTTYGKCYGSWTIPDSADPPRHNWAMQPIVFKYANAEGFTDFISGIDPDIEVRDNLLEAEPFGSIQDPHLAAALEQITGVSPVLKSKPAGMERIEALPVPRSQMPDFPYRREPVPIRK